MKSHKILDRIDKLQKLSANNNNPNEAEQAAEQAMRLMREHAVSQAEVDAVATMKEDPMVRQACYLDGLRVIPYEEKTVHIYKTAAWKRSLFGNVANYFGLRWSWRPGTAIMTVYGHLSDVQAAMKLYGTCARQIDRTCADWCARQKKLCLDEGRWWGWDIGIAKAKACQFRESAVQGLQAKFNALTRESAAEHATEHGLVLSRRSAVSAWVDATYTFAKGKSAGLVSGERGYNPDGYRVGRELKLTEDAELEAGKRRALPATP